MATQGQITTAGYLDTALGLSLAFPFTV